MQAGINVCGIAKVTMVFQNIFYGRKQAIYQQKITATLFGIPILGDYSGISDHVRLCDYIYNTFKILMHEHWHLRKNYQGLILEIVKLKRL